MIRAIVKRPDEEYGHVTNVSDKLETLQKTVGGYIETVTWQPLMRQEDAFVVVCDEEGLLKDEPYNCTVWVRDQRWYDRGPMTFFGTIVVLGVDGDEFADCPVDFQDWKKMVSRELP